MEHRSCRGPHRRGQVRLRAAHGAVGAAPPVPDAPARGRRRLPRPAGRLAGPRQAGRRPTGGDAVEQRAKRAAGERGCAHGALRRPPRRETSGPEVPTALAPRDSFGPVAVPGERSSRSATTATTRRTRASGARSPPGNLEGRAVFVYWSCDAAPTRPFPGRGAALRRVLDTALHFFERTRWERTSAVR